MKRHLLCGASTLMAISMANSVAAHATIAPQQLPAKASLAVVDTPQGFAIVANRNDLCGQPVPSRLPLGNSISIDAKLIHRGPGR